MRQEYSSKAVLNTRHQHQISLCCLQPLKNSSIFSIRELQINFPLKYIQAGQNNAILYPRVVLIFNLHLTKLILVRGGPSNFWDFKICFALTFLLTFTILRSKISCSMLKLWYLSWVTCGKIHRNLHILYIYI